MGSQNSTLAGSAVHEGRTDRQSQETGSGARDHDPPPTVIARADDVTEQAAQLRCGARVRGIRQRSDTVAAPPDAGPPGSWGAERQRSWWIMPGGWRFDLPVTCACILTPASADPPMVKRGRTSLEVQRGRSESCGYPIMPERAQHRNADRAGDGGSGRMEHWRHSLRGWCCV